MGNRESTIMDLSFAGPFEGGHYILGVVGCKYGFTWASHVTGFCGFRAVMPNNTKRKMHQTQSITINDACSFVFSVLYLPCVVLEAPSKNIFKE